jgi:hypothetical protein
LTHKPDGALGPIEIQADDVADLVNRTGVLGELSRLLAVRLQPERPPDPLHRDRVRPTSLAMERVDQCVASVGVVSSV